MVRCGRSHQGLWTTLLRMEKPPIRSDSFSLEATMQITGLWGKKASVPAQVGNRCEWVMLSQTQHSPTGKLLVPKPTLVFSNPATQLSRPKATGHCLKSWPHDTCSGLPGELSPFTLSRCGGNGLFFSSRTSPPLHPPPQTFWSGCLRG